MNVLEEMEDKDLLTLAGHGDEEAFSALYRRHLSFSVGTARHWGAGAEAEDLVSEVFTQIWSLIKRGCGPSDHFKAYVHTGVRNACNRQSKMVARTRPVEDWVLDRPVYDGPELSFPPELVDDVRDAFESIPVGRWKKILVEIDIEGRSRTEVAAEMGMSVEAVSSLLYRAHNHLKGALS